MVWIDEATAATEECAGIMRSMLRWARSGFPDDPAALALYQRQQAITARLKEVFSAAESIHPCGLPGEGAPTERVRIAWLREQIEAMKEEYAARVVEWEKSILAGG